MMKLKQGWVPKFAGKSGSLPKPKSVAVVLKSSLQKHPQLPENHFNCQE
jgi:hypothetical protein